MTDITSTKKAAAEITCSAARASIRGTRSRRAHSSPCLRYKLQACTAHAFTRNVGMHCACVHTNSNLMRGFVANPPLVGIGLTRFGVAYSCSYVLLGKGNAVGIFWIFPVDLPRFGDSINLCCLFSLKTSHISACLLLLFLSQQFFLK